MKCFNCNSEIAEGTNFCPHCGAQQPSIQQQLQYPQQYPQQTPQQYPQNYQQGYPQNFQPDPMMRPAPPQRPPKNNTATVVIIAIAAVLIVAIIAFVAIYLLGKGKSEEKEVVPTEQVSQSGLDEHQYDWLSERLVTAADLSGKSAGDLRLMRNAMFAKHGYKFKSKDLQEYFSNFSWYTPLYSEVDNQLSKIEQANVNFIKKFENGSGAGAGSSAATPSRISSVGFTGDFSDVACYTWLTDADVRGLSKSQLRILRNTIFARHGRKFVSADLRNYFNQFSWYNPRYDEIPMNYLSETEQHNINLIKRYE